MAREGRRQDVSSRVASKTRWRVKTIYKGCELDGRELLCETWLSAAVERSREGMKGVGEQWIKIFLELVAGIRPPGWVDHSQLKSTMSL